MNYKSRIAALATIALLFLLHLLFLHADPDYFLSFSRDAFTDEGLNTSQVRNYINHGYLDLNECDDMIKSPLFNLLLYLPLKIFGTHLIVARITVLLCLLISLLVICRHDYFSQMIPLLFATTLIQYYVFQYSHFSLSEMIAVSSIFFGVFFLFRFFHEQKRYQLFLSALFLSVTYYLKIQFVYIIVLLPASFIMNWITGIVAINHIKRLSQGIFWLLLFAGIYFVAWYLPFQHTYHYVMSDQVTGKFAGLRRIPYTILFNITYVLFSGQTWWFNSLVAICFFIGAFVFIRSQDTNFKILFMLGCLWMFIELHKISMLYLPSRYLVSYYFAAGLMCSVVLRQMLLFKIQHRILRRIAVALLTLFFIGNSIYYGLLLGRRSYHIQEVNDYFASTLKNTNQPVMGVWGANTTWDCRARTIPVWRDFMNDKDIINRFHPQAIVSEPDEAESNQAYSAQGIKLQEIADSSRAFEVGKWKVIVYWVK